MSCSPEESESPEISSIDIVINESPWTFDHAESQLVLNSDYEFTDSEREEIINKINRDLDIAYEGSLIFFNKDGTGIYDSPGYCQECDFDWELIDNETFRWAVRASFNYCTLKSSGIEPELIWEWTDGSTYNRNGEIIEYSYNVNLVFR